MEEKAGVALTEYRELGKLLTISCIKSDTYDANSLYESPLLAVLFIKIMISVVFTLSNTFVMFDTVKLMNALVVSHDEDEDEEEEEDEEAGQDVMERGSQEEEEDDEST